MAHKIGGCKPLGAGSALITIDRFEINPDAAARYHRAAGSAAVYVDTALQAELSSRTALLRADTSNTMQALRRLMRFDPGGTHDFRYPLKGNPRNPGWFDDPVNRPKSLKPWNMF